MAGHLAIRCACGTVGGSAVGAAGPAARRAVCYCRDCRMFAHYLGRAEATLDAYGGTEVLLLSQARLRIERGIDRLACVRLTPRGLLRWHAACCDTPIGNVFPHRRIPYLGLVHACIDYTATGDRPDHLHGPVAMRLYGRHLVDVPGAPTASAGMPPSALMAIGIRVLGWYLRGDHRRSPLFDRATGEPVANPRVLTSDEWHDLAARATGGSPA